MPVTDSQKIRSTLYHCHATLISFASLKKSAPDWDTLPYLEGHVEQARAHLNYVEETAYLDTKDSEDSDSEIDTMCIKAGGLSNGYHGALIRAAKRLNLHLGNKPLAKAVEAAVDMSGRHQMWAYISKERDSMDASQYSMYRKKYRPAPSLPCDETMTSLDELRSKIQSRILEFEPPLEAEDDTSEVDPLVKKLQAMDSTLAGIRKASTQGTPAAQDAPSGSRDALRLALRSAGDGLRRVLTPARSTDTCALTEYLSEEDQFTAKKTRFAFNNLQGS